MIRVLEVNVDDNGYGGVYAFVLNILENIGKEFQIDLCSFEKFEKQSNIDYVESFGGKVHYCGHPGSLFTKQKGCLDNLRKLVKEEHYDVVHIHSDVSYKLVLYALAAKAGGAKKILIHSHSSGVEGKHRRTKLMLQHVAKRLILYVANQFLACSQKAAEWMYPQRILNGTRFALINNGINVEKFAFDPAVRTEMRKELGLEDNFVIGHVGRFSYQKNHSFLINIFKEVVAINPKAKLLLIGSYVGDPVYLNETKNQVKDFGLEDNVLFMGLRNDVPRLMQAMDCFLLPSRLEGLCFVGVESQAAGLPSFFSDTITKELQITDLAHFISLETSTEKWAKIILKDSKISRRDMQEAITAAGYDIKYEIRKLMQDYKS